MEDVYIMARRKSRYGRRDWLVWSDASGERHAHPKTRETLKAALLACGTKRTFTMLCGGIEHRINWPMGILMLRNAKWWNC